MWNWMWPITRLSFNTVTEFLSLPRQRLEPKIKSLKEAIIGLEDMTEYFTSENLTETVNDPSYVLSYIQFTLLSRKLNASVQSKVTDIFKWIRCPCVNNIAILLWDYDIWSWNFFRINLLLLQLRNWTTFSHKTVCFGFHFDKSCVPKVFSESPLNTDTRIIRTLWHVPLESVLTGFHCIMIDVIYS